MGRRRSLTPKALGYEEVLVVQHRKRHTKPLRRLYSVKRRITDPINEDFFTEMEIIVPHPTLDCPIPCCLVFIEGSNGKLWFRASIEALIGFFGLNEPDIAGLREALRRAEAIAEGYKQVQREIAGLLREQENLLREQEKIK